MLNTHSLKVGCFAAILFAGTAASPHAFGSVPARAIALTFNRPFAIPGVALTAGTYVFELAAPGTDTTIVRVLSSDRSQVYWAGYTYLVRRPGEMRQDHQIVFGESAPGVAPPIRIWYPQDDSGGRQFIYPHDSRQLLSPTAE
jgi:hypothetical protein